MTADIVKVTHVIFYTLKYLQDHEFFMEPTCSYSLWREHISEESDWK